MVERTYDYRLVVHGKVVYEGRIERSNPREALCWGLYWMPGDWFEGGRDEAVHAEIAAVNPGRSCSMRPYSTNYTRNASGIRRFDDDDVRCLVSGQDLVWMIYDENGHPAHGRAFQTREDAEQYMYDRQLWGSCRVGHVWVDGWYDEQYSWKRTEVKGYEGLGMEERDREDD